MKYLVYIRPTEELLTPHLISDEGDLQGAMQNLNCYLWIRKDRQWTTEQFTRELRSLTTKHLTANLGIGLWRQLMAGLGRVILPLKEYNGEDENEEETDIMDAQRGHTAAISRRHYAITSSQIGQLDAVILNKYRKSSTLVHSILFGIQPPADPSNQHIESDQGCRRSKVSSQLHERLDRIEANAEMTNSKLDTILSILGATNKSQVRKLVF